MDAGYMQLMLWLAGQAPGLPHLPAVSLCKTYRRSTCRAFYPRAKHIGPYFVGVEALRFRDDHLPSRHETDKSGQGPLRADAGQEGSLERHPLLNHQLLLER